MFDIKNGQKLYKIDHFDKMDPFLMSLISSDDYWMYISSTGCLTAGRKNAETCLFPYDTVDKLHNNAHIVGPVSIIRIKEKNETHIWEPFIQYNSKYKIKRNLYKNCISNTIIFEEHNISLKLTFRYQWHISKGFGFVKESTIINKRNKNCDLSILDGLQNIMASGITLRTQQEMSNLSNAYRCSEILKESKCGVYTLTSLLMDSPKPGESLYANLVWCLSNFKYKISLCSTEILRFRKNLNFRENNLIEGKPGSFLINMTECIKSDNQISWSIISDVHKTQHEIADLEQKILDKKELRYKIIKGIKSDEYNLEKYIGNADGFQCTDMVINDMHHTANILYNVMRGGILFNDYKVDKNDFISFIKIRNRHVFDIHQNILNKITNDNNMQDIVKIAIEKNDLSFIRLCYNYIPITFGRRHGDPSRPWNQFNIKVRDKNEKQLLYYEGNWRDIFQNWEALSLSFPLVLESILSNFINNCTADGFNPYRITRDGIDWEILESENSWSNIGYWNDHQIIYLLKILEHFSRFNSNKLVYFLNQDIFSYANVPYEIKEFEKLIEDPKQSINFNYNKNNKINNLVDSMGTDAKLIMTDNNQIYHVNLLEKLLVLVLAKLSNFIPGGGIWLNTQRPEWNDANNALAGHGLSMVTVYYLRRFFVYFKSLLSKFEKKNSTISNEVLYWFQGIYTVLNNHQSLIDNKIIKSENKMKIVKDLGSIYSEYKKQLYDDGFSGKSKIDKEKIFSFIDISIRYIDHTISLNKNRNRLYHSYNIIRFSKNNSHLEIDYLYEMLEGQVAILSSGYLNSEQSIQLIENLYASKMYRRDQKTFMLYPIKKLNSFMEKNIIPKALILKSSFLSKMIKLGNNQILSLDIQGNYRFNANFKNILDLKTALQNLEIDSALKNILKKEMTIIMDIYENVFNHKFYSGRSSNMFAYEGIGSVYWHMVSKLLLAVQEIFYKSVFTNEDKATIEKLGQLYYKIRSGLSSEKTPEEYGAFPFDAYSHTPYKAGAKQPGMTGQVKEEIITRMGELGCFVDDGKIIFNPILLKKSEFLKKKRKFTFFNFTNEKVNMNLQKKQLGFTYSKVPVIYHLSEEDWSIKIYFINGEVQNIIGNKLNKNISAEIFHRNNKVKQILLQCPESSLLF